MTDMEVKMALRQITLGLVTAALLCASSQGLALAHAQDEAAADPRELRARALLGVAISVDGAMGADLALRLLETDQLPTRGLRSEACDVARARLREADDPVPVEFIDGRHIACMDCREWSTYAGLLTLPVDALSLRSRLAMQLVRQEPKEALELLLEVPPGFDVSSAGCRDVLIARPDVYFRALREVLLAATSATERREGRHWEIARWYLVGCASISSIGPACEMLLALDAPKPVAETLVGDMCVAIDKIGASSREVFHLGERKRGVEAIAALFDQLEQTSPARKQLLESIRAVILRSLAAPRCQDVSRAPMPEIVTYFNETLLVDHPISRDDVTQPGTGESAIVKDGWTSSTSRRLLTDFQILNTARREMEPEADLTAWKLEFGKLASRIRSWSSVDEADDYDYIAHKTSLIGSMINVAPDEASRLEAVRDFVAMMRHAKRSSIPAHVLLSYTATTLGRLPASDRTTALQMFKSGPGVLSAYATFQLEGIDVFRIAPPVS